MTLWGELTELRIKVIGTHAGNLTISGPARAGRGQATSTSTSRASASSPHRARAARRRATRLPAADWFRGAFTVSAAAEPSRSPPRRSNSPSRRVGHVKHHRLLSDGRGERQFRQCALSHRLSAPGRDGDAADEKRAALSWRALAVSASGATANSADGFVLTGERPWCVHGFIRWRNNFNTKCTMRAGTAGVSAWWRRPDSLGDGHRPRLTCYDGSSHDGDGNSDWHYSRCRRTSITSPSAGTATNIFIKRSRTA